ncbi:MAG: hypothetical protein ABGW87_07310 [Sphingomonadaceae bacterium]
MLEEDDLNHALTILGSEGNAVLPDGFMDGVWLLAGRLEEVKQRRNRSVFFLAMAMIGLGAGFGVTQAPAKAQTAGYQLVEGTDLSPAALLHVQP